MMRRLVIAFSMLAALGMILAGLPALAQSPHIPHENPATAAGGLDGATLLLSYSRIYEAATGRQYETAQGMLAQLKQVDIPAELRYICDRYETLSVQVMDNLNSAETLLGEASTSFSEGRINEAKAELDAAQAASDAATSRLEDVQSATDVLADSLGIFAAGATSPARQAYDLLNHNLSRVRQLADELGQLRKSLVADPEAAVSASFYHPTPLWNSPRPQPPTPGCPSPSAASSAPPMTTTPGPPGYSWMVSSSPKPPCPPGSNLS